MITQRIKELFVYTIIGFTIGHAAFSYLMMEEFELYETIAYHYSHSIFWYLLFFGLPACIGLCLYLWMKDKYLRTTYWWLCVIVAALQVLLTIGMTTANYVYWGYFFRRPTLFQEVKEADKFLMGTSVSNKDSTGIRILFATKDSMGYPRPMPERENLYYYQMQRAVLSFEDRRLIYVKNNNLAEFYKNTERQHSPQLLGQLDEIIHNTGLLHTGRPDFFDGRLPLEGLLSEFRASDSTQYLFLGLMGWEVGNDHYPIYEFLLNKEGDSLELIKSQRYYVDIAGVEKLEYQFVGPFISLLLVASGAILTLLILMFTKKPKKFPVIEDR